MKVLAVVLAAVLVSAVAAQAGPYGLGFWAGYRTLGIMSGAGSPVTVGAMELGGAFNWQFVDHLALRGSIAYNTGSYSVKVTTTTSGGTSTTEDKDSYSGFPIEVNLLPTFKVGEKLTIRAGGGLAYHKYSDKYTETRTSSGGVITTTSFPSASISGIGGQFIFSTEGKLSEKVGLELQYKKDNASLSRTWNYTVTPGVSVEEKSTVGVNSDTYRLGFAIYF